MNCIVLYSIQKPYNFFFYKKNLFFWHISRKHDMSRNLDEHKEFCTSIYMHMTSLCPRHIIALLVTICCSVVASVHSVCYILHMICALTSWARPPSHAVLKHSLAVVIKVFPQVTQKL